tara:strand:- start:4395 stop:5249 length:855 start_codon:yes stop_codon:yes gene_type:complete
MYKFDKNRRRAKQCPCGRSNRNGKFAPYAGYEEYGYCHSCCKSFAPKQKEYIPVYVPEKPKFVSYIGDSIFKKSLINRADNKFYQFISYKFGSGQADMIFDKYCLGTAARWKGATVFWQVDRELRVRTGKVMLYNPNTGRRVKQCNDWAHSILKRTHYFSDFNLEQCLFGLYLVDETNANIPIAIVESEKTACIMSLFCPEYIWLACGGLSALSYEKIKPIKRHKIVLFPDLGPGGDESPYALWSEKAKEYNALGCKISVSDKLERRATEKQRREKWDIADFCV